MFVRNGDISLKFQFPKIAQVEDNSGSSCLSKERDWGITKIPIEDIGN